MTRRRTARTTLLAPLLVGLLSAGPTHGAEEEPPPGRRLFVSVSGDDAAAGSESAPWRTLGRALAEVRPGDTVLVRAGTYAATSRGSWEPAFHPARGGTAERRIVLRAFPGEEVVLRNDATRIGEAYPGPTIGALQRDHVTWEGFRLAEGERIAVFGSRGVEIVACTVSGVRPGPGHPGNVDAVRIERSADCAVRRCRLTDASTGEPTDSNGCGVKLYSTERVVVEACEIERCGSGVHDKEQGPGARILRNRIRGCFVGVRVGMQKGPTRDVEIAGNTILEAGTAVYLAVPRADGWGDYRVRANTIVASENGVVSLGAADVVVEDNVFSDVKVPLEVRANVGTDPHMIRSDYNAFHGAGEFRTGSYTASALRFASLSDWRAATSNDRSSIEGDPRFVDAGALDFRLRKDSPLRRRGRGGATIGAFTD